MKVPTSSARYFFMLSSSFIVLLDLPAQSEPESRAWPALPANSSGGEGKAWRTTGWGQGQKNEYGMRGASFAEDGEWSQEELAARVGRSDGPKAKAPLTVKFTQRLQYLCLIAVLC
jgi:hypothetical protein